MSKSTETLKHVLGSLSVEDIIELNNVAIRRKYPNDVVVCHEGELEHTFYVIESGLVAVTHRMKDNTEQVLGILRDGEFFGEMGLIDDVPRSATIRTLTECVLIEIHEETFDTIIARNPSVAITLLKDITRRLRDTDKIAISELELRNHELARALEDLKTAQAELLRQERLKRDLEIASDVQRSILPKSFPNVPKFEFGVQSRPAREVGGDFYDVIKITEDKYAIVVADVSGKGWNAAIYMAIVRALLLRETEEDLSPSQTMQKLHSQLLKTTRAEMFVTIFYGLLEAKTGHLHFVRAGHEVPILYRAIDNSFELLDPPGSFVGSWPGVVVDEAKITLNTNDCLICYSDGITESENKDEELFGIDRVMAIVKEKKQATAQEIVNYIMDGVDQFKGDTPQSDDITILVVKAT